MSDAEVNSPTPSSTGVWTDEARYQFLLRVVLQWKDDGKTISWSRMNMPGRTTKSLQNQWTKVLKAVSELEKEQGGDGAATAAPVKGRAKTPNSTPRKSKAKKSNINVKTEDVASESQEDTPTKPAKRANEDDTPSKSAKKQRKATPTDPVKKEEEQETDEIMT